jgi:multidrug resistance efflux pump
MRKPGKRMMSVIAGIAAVCVMTGGIGYQAIASGAQTNSTEQNEKGQDTDQQESSDGSFSEDGTTQIGATSQMPEFTVNAVTMTVEEIYATSGDTVSKGDALFKLTDESMESAKAYYEDAIHDAENTLKTAKADLASGQLSAESAKQDSDLTAQTAEENYQAQIDALDAAVEEKKEAYDEVVEQISEYQTKIDNNDYYVECAIDEKKAAVDAAETALAQAQDTLTQAQESDNSTSQAVSADLSNIREQIGAGADSDTLISIVQQAVDDYTAREQQSDILTAAQQAADAAQKEFDSAVETYNKNVEETNTKITELTESLDNLKSDYEQAARDAKTQKAELKNEYDTAVVEGKYAGSTYEATVSELESAVESAQNTLDTLKEEQTALIALENGVVTADEDGTIAAVPYEAGDTLQPGTAFALYCDTQTIMISVEVSQEKVAQVHVGEEVSVMISGNREGAVTGIVSSIASSATTGGSVSNVTYAVIISIDNPDGKLGSGSSATVIFQGEQEEKTE